MTDIEQKARDMVLEVLRESELPREPTPITREYWKALCRAIERHEAFRQEMSDALLEYYGGYHNASGEPLERFIIPAPQPDPLVEALHEVDTGPEWDSAEDYCNKVRAALGALGFEIREKGQ